MAKRKRSACFERTVWMCCTDEGYSCEHARWNERENGYEACEYFCPPVTCTCKAAQRAARRRGGERGN